MIYYYIVCKSLTFAQQTARALERAGINAYILRTPREIASLGCSHSVKISAKRLMQALTVLKRVDLTPRQVYLAEPDGSYREVRL